MNINISENSSESEPSRRELYLSHFSLFSHLQFFFRKPANHAPWPGLPNSSFNLPEGGGLLFSWSKTKFKGKRDLGLLSGQVDKAGVANELRMFLYPNCTCFCEQMVWILVSGILGRAYN